MLLLRAVRTHAHFITQCSQALTIEELQAVHKHLSEAAANILEKLGQKKGVLHPAEVGDRLSLLRRIAELEGDLRKKQKQTQQKSKLYYFYYRSG